MSENYLGQITAYAFNYAPRNWLMCQGQTLPVNQYQALFSLLGTNFGGNGQTTFMLPDLRSRVPIASGVDPAGNQYTLGQTGGTESVTIVMNQMPAGQHSHTLNGSNALAVANNPAPVYSLAPAVLQDSPVANAPMYLITTPATPMVPTGSVGGQPHANIMPYQALNFCIAMSGVYPSRG
jgi:microcystin-dependent protein